MNHVRILMTSFGVIYLWFGLLKFFPGISPAEVLAGETIRLLTFDLISTTVGIKLLAILESVIGVACIFGFAPKFTVKLIIAHMVCTFTPIFLMPDQVFGEAMMSLTLVGQYILKNLVFVSALLIAYKLVSAKEREAEVEAKVKAATSPAPQKPERTTPAEPLIVFKDRLSDSEAA